MSSKLRRRNAKIAHLVKMDANYARLYLMSSPHRDARRAWRLWFGCIVPLGDKLGARAWVALPRCSTGKDILLLNYRKRHAPILQKL